MADTPTPDPKVSARTVTRYSTREIVTDAIGLDRIDLLHGGPKALGHNPSWIKAFDVDQILAQQDEEIARLTRDSEILRTCGIVEIAVANESGSVSEYMEHWEGRALKAEALWNDIGQHINAACIGYNYPQIKAVFEMNLAFKAERFALTVRAEAAEAALAKIANIPPDCGCRDDSCAKDIAHGAIHASDKS